MLGLGTAAGSLNQVVFSPLGQLYIAHFGWYIALLILAATALAIIPLDMVLPGQYFDAKAACISATSG